ncbi:hypothetical protein [Nocardioides zeae]
MSHQVVAYLRRREPGGEVIGEQGLDLPVRSLRTAAVWWTVPSTVLAELEAGGVAAGDLPGAAHAAEHCSIGLLPSSPPVTAGTSAASRPSCTPTPAD